MEDKARWMLKSNLTTEKQVPNFVDYIYGVGRGSKPKAMNIIRKPPARFGEAMD